MVQWVKDLVLPQLRHRLKLWLRFDPWPGNFHMQPKKKKKKIAFIHFTHIRGRGRRHIFITSEKVLSDKTYLRDIGSDKTLT